MKRWLMTVALVCSATSLAATPYRTPVPPHFDSRGADRQAIEALLGHYTQAVSTKDQALFETLLLSKAIPFSGVPLSGKGGNAQTANYEGFRKAVFEGSPFHTALSRHPYWTGHPNAQGAPSGIAPIIA